MLRLPMTEKRVAALAVLAAVCIGWFSSPIRAAGQSESASSPKLAAVKYVTWWSHDATGYHPAIYFLLANTSNLDLSGQHIKFQALFRDIQNGYVTVGRKETSQDFHPNQMIYVDLRGPRAFELPIDKYSWPRIECKVMCRVGNVADEGTQDLLLANLDQKTLSDEEAFGTLMDNTGAMRPVALAQSRQQHRHVEHRADAGKPLVATALPLAAAQHAKVPPGGRSLSHFVADSPRLAGLGDDFYDFDQIFGRALDFDARDGRWTWVRYGHTEPSFNLYVAARQRTSKADIVVVVIPADEVQQPDNLLLSFARLLSGKQKNQVLTSPNHTVKYLPSGRIQITTAESPGYKAFFVNPRSGNPDENNYVLVLSRVPGDYRAILADNAKRVSMLRFLAPLVGDVEQDHY